VGDKYARQELNTSVACEKEYGKHRSLLRCPKICKFFPCPQLYQEGWVEKLYNCEAFEHEFKKWKRRRVQMYFVEYENNEIVKVNDLDETNPDKDLIKDCKRVYKVTKELEPVIVLKPVKPTGATNNINTSSSSNRSSTGQVGNGKNASEPKKETTPKKRTNNKSKTKTGG